MRWPLRNQLLWRILLLLLVAIATFTWLSIWNSISLSRQEELARANRVTDLLKEANFPMTQPVLNAMRSLSDAEFVVATVDGRQTARTIDAPDFPTGQGRPQPERVHLNGRDYFHSSVSQRPISPGSSALVSSLFLPCRSTRDILWQASQSPLLVAAIVLPFAALIGMLFAYQITRPLTTLTEKSEQLSNGQPIEIELGQRNDEISDLFATMNRMAHRINENREELKLAERNSTLVQVGNGIAHNLRNASTGCRMALDLLGTTIQEVQSSEEFQVAKRQLDQIDTYVSKFLDLSKSDQDRSTSGKSPGCRIRPVLDECIELLSPTAKHLGVKLSSASITDVIVLLDKEDARQAIINLVNNAIRAASEASVRSSIPIEPFVKIALNVDSAKAELVVMDNGNGPPPEIAKQIFLPFVTGSPEGTGLGLSLVKRIVEESGGEIRWWREAKTTCFAIKIDLMNGEQ